MFSQGMVAPRNGSSCINIPADAIRHFAFEMIDHELENIFSVDRNNLRAGSAGPCATDLYGLAGHDRGLVSAEIS
jgi:hypothetical protein